MHHWPDHFGEEEVTLAELCAQVASDCEVWIRIMRPSSKGALLSLMVALFADVSGAQLPLIQVQDLELEVAPGWWPLAATRNASPREDRRAG